MSPYLAEFIGMAGLIYLGTSVNANLCLRQTKAGGGAERSAAHWLLISLGWGVAVLIPVLLFADVSGAHFNPAITLGLAAIGGFAWSSVPLYLLAQMGGAVLGASLTYLHYKAQFDRTKDNDIRRGIFCTAPEIYHTRQNLTSELLATFVLVFAIVGFRQTALGAQLNMLGVGGLIFIIGAALGGTTGYAINPARDFGPRLAFAILFRRQKADADWRYSPIPILGPFLGGIAGAWLANLIF